MKYAGLIVVLAVAVVLGCSSDDPGKSTPEDTVRGYLKACTDLDVESLCSYMVEEQDCLTALLEEELPDVDASVETPEFELMTIQISADIAEVEVSYKLETQDAETEGREIPSVIYELVKVSDEWLIQDMSLDGNFEDNEASPERIDFANVQLAVTATMAIPDPPIVNLETDERIDSIENEIPTNDMTSGGLITILQAYLCVDEEDYCHDNKVTPPSFFLEKNESEYYYTIEANGKVYGFYDETGLEPIER